MSAAVGERHLGPSVDVKPARGATRAVALVLPGGKVDSFDPTRPGQLAVARMRPFARLLHQRGGGLGLAVWSVGYRYRGWNGADLSPVADAVWAIGEARRRHGDVPVVLVGHSMGARAALRAAAEEPVRGVCALAPWVEGSDPVRQLAGRAVFIAHGNADVVTSAKASRRYAAAAAQVTSPVGRVVVGGDLHAMLLRWPTWHRLAAEFTLGSLDLAPYSDRIRRAFEAGAAGRFDVPV